MLCTRWKLRTGPDSANAEEAAQYSLLRDSVVISDLPEVLCPGYRLHLWLEPSTLLLFCLSQLITGRLQDRMLWTPLPLVWTPLGEIALLPEPTGPCATCLSCVLHWHLNMCIIYVCVFWCSPLHVASIAHLSVLGEGSLTCVSRWGFHVVFPL